MRKQWPGAGSDIGSEIDEFVEQNAGLSQHPLDLVCRLGDRAPGGVDRQFAVGGRLVIVADPGERLQCTRARLGVMALGIAAFAYFGRRRDIDFTEQIVSDAPRRGTIFPGGRDRGDDRDVPVAGEMGGDFGQPANILGAVGNGEAEVGRASCRERV